MTIRIERFGRDMYMETELPKKSVRGPILIEASRDCVELLEAQSGGLVTISLHKESVEALSVFLEKWKKERLT